MISRRSAHTNQILGPARRASLRPLGCPGRGRDFNSERPVQRAGSGLNARSHLQAAGAVTLRKPLVTGSLLARRLDVSGRAGLDPCRKAGAARHATRMTGRAALARLRSGLKSAAGKVGFRWARSDTRTQSHPANVRGQVPCRYRGSRAALRLLLPEPPHRRAPRRLGAIPIFGDILRYTISPVFGWLTMPLTKRMMFAPSSMTKRSKAEYSTAMALRPSQIRATVVDGALMVPNAANLRAHHRELAIPTVVMAGDGDMVVSHRHAERLHARNRGSALQIVPGVGHMVHHVATPHVVQAIVQVSGGCRGDRLKPGVGMILGRS